jgi:HdeA/HdeB family protein
MNPCSDDVHDRDFYEAFVRCQWRIGGTCAAQKGWQKGAAWISWVAAARCQPWTSRHSQRLSGGNDMKSVTALALVLLVCSLYPANAVPDRKLPPVDFSKMSCVEFWKKTIASDRGPFLFWLSGYFGHQKNSPVLDPVEFTEKTKALSEYCSKQPDDSILSAAEKAFVN